MAERGIIYGRASRDPRGGGTSVNKQLERGRDFAAREGIDVVAEKRDDNQSASRGSRERDGFLQVRALLDSGQADLLILWEVSRSSRDLEEFMGLVNACADQGVEIAVSGTRYDPAEVDDWLPLVLQGVMAEAEARRITKRNRDSVETNAKRGTPHGRIPYGYRRVYDPKTGTLIDQTPYIAVSGDDEPERDGDGDVHPVLPGDPVRKTFSTEAQVVRDATDALLRGLTLRQVCRDLNAAGIPTPRRPREKTLKENPTAVQTTWEPSTLRQILKNPTMAGRRVHQGIDIGQASWAPIVDYGKWLRLKALLDDPARMSVKQPRGPAPRHLLTGIARCGECDAFLKASLNKSRIPRAYVCQNEGCRSVTVNADRADEKVERSLSALFAREDFRAVLAAAYDRREQAVEKGPDLASLIREREAELAEVDALRDAGELTVRSYARESSRIEKQIEDLRSRQMAPVRSQAIRRLLSFQSLADGWDEADLMNRREIVRLMLDVRILRATVRGRNFDYNRVQVEPGELLSAHGRSATA